MGNPAESDPQAHASAHHSCDFACPEGDAVDESMSANPCARSCRWSPAAVTDPLGGMRDGGS